MYLWNGRVSLDLGYYQIIKCNIINKEMAGEKSTRVLEDLGWQGSRDTYYVAVVKSAPKSR